MVEPLVINPYDVDSTRFIRVAGEIDIATAPQLAAVLDECDGKAVCVDLADVTFVDSYALSVLSKAHRRAVEHGAAFTVRNTAANVRKVFEVTKLDYMLAVEPK